ncbi:hypothetical protein CCACVL1_05349 [Corchorus capsularis]|uniref:Uncharacterized protein n=1 Tax=Corchorus capsularis TaxID=210143 RepID=A0A1R3JLD7_COCAP|nr:hypothetical protein CCACVL1_05349 [Corchorus capsularis]
MATKTHPMPRLFLSFSEVAAPLITQPPWPSLKLHRLQLSFLFKSCLSLLLSLTNPKPFFFLSFLAAPPLTCSQHHRLRRNQPRNSLKEREDLLLHVWDEESWQRTHMSYMINGAITAPMWHAT